MEEKSWVLDGRMVVDGVAGGRKANVPQMHRDRAASKSVDALALFNVVIIYFLLTDETRMLIVADVSQVIL